MMIMMMIWRRKKDKGLSSNYALFDGVDIRDEDYDL
jgi:hypothetical protein